MARNKKGSKPRKSTSGGKRKAGRAGSGAKGKKTAGKKAGKKTVKKAGKKAARRASSAKRAPAKKKGGKKSAGKAKSKSATSKRRPARKSGKKTSTSRRPAVRPGGSRATARRSRAPSRDAAFFDHFRRRLLEQRDDITRRLDELRDELRGLEETPRELEEWAQEEKDRDILIRLEDRETEELRKIQAALQLIDRREYGLCQICGKPIPRARLEELPTAFRCVDCTP